MSHEEDIEKAQLEKDLTKLDADISTDSETLAEGKDLPAIEGAPADGEKVLEIPPRGRHNSRSSISSGDSGSSTSRHGHDHQLPPHRDRSRAQSSTRSVRRNIVKVPRSQRRGLLARFTVIAEVTNPYDYPRSMKWMLTVSLHPQRDLLETILTQ